MRRGWGEGAVLCSSPTFTSEQYEQYKGGGWHVRPRRVWVSLVESRHMLYTGTTGQHRISYVLSVASVTIANN